jgi:hypothetical protein
MNDENLIASSACCEQGPIWRSQNCSLMSVLLIFPSEFSEMFTVIIGLLFIIIIIIIANGQPNLCSN